MATAEDLVAKVARGAELQRVIFFRHSPQLDFLVVCLQDVLAKLQPLLPSAGKEPNSNTPSLL